MKRLIKKANGLFFVPVPKYEKGSDYDRYFSDYFNFVNEHEPDKFKNKLQKEMDMLNLLNR